MSVFRVQMNKTLASPCRSNWLKAALRTADGRDPVDVLHDLEELRRLFKLKLGEMSNPLVHEQHTHVPE